MRAIIRFLKRLCGAIGFLILISSWIRKANATKTNYKGICMVLAQLDDCICRNELEGNWINGREIKFPPKAESIDYRYHLFLETYKKHSQEDLKQVYRTFKARLAESENYRDQPPEHLEIHWEGVQK